MQLTDPAGVSTPEPASSLSAGGGRRGTPPAVALLAAALGVLGSLLLTVTVCFVVTVSVGAGPGAATGWFLTGVPVALSVAVVAGAVRLLLGRSWLALSWSASAMAGVVLVATRGILEQRGLLSVPLLFLLAPLLAGVLAALPPVRRWVGECTAARAAG